MTKNNKKEVKQPAEEKVENETQEVKNTVKIYPDIEFNKKERRKTLVLGLILIFMLGGMGAVTILQGGQTALMMGIVMIVFVVFGIAMIPSGFKQYPIKNEPIIEVGAKEAVINGKTFKISDISEVRLTITLAPVGTKAENEKFLNEIMSAEPERNITANLDFTMKIPVDNKGKDKNIYTTVANAYEGLLAFYKAGCKHYRIIYSMKKLTRVSTYDLGDTVTESGKKLSQISKKDRVKQLY